MGDWSDFALGISVMLVVFIMICLIVMGFNDMNKELSLKEKACIKEGYDDYDPNQEICIDYNGNYIKAEFYCNDKRCILLKENMK